MDFSKVKNPGYKNLNHSQTKQCRKRTRVSFCDKIISYFSIFSRHRKIHPEYEFIDT
jgi:hypothetical protein